MNLTFRNIRAEERGILRTILEAAYAPLKALNEPPWIPSDDLWQEYDDHVFEDLDDSDEDILLTEIDGTAVGFASFTTHGDGATIGRNAVVPAHGGKGIGAAQVQEIIRRCRERKVSVIYVLTGEHAFFEPARRMYLRAGFTEVSREDDGNGVGRVLVRYRLDLG